MGRWCGGFFEGGGRVYGVGVSQGNGFVAVVRGRRAGMEGYEMDDACCGMEEEEEEEKEKEW